MELGQFLKSVKDFLPELALSTNNYFKEYISSDLVMPADYADYLA